MPEIVLIAWVPICLALFAVLPARRAVLIAVIAGWLFLPQTGFKVGGLPPYTKMTATCLAAFLGTVAFDSGRLLSLRPRLVDLPMLVWCVCPMATSLDNGLGIHDGCTAVFQRTVMWGLPYLLGRVYFCDSDGMKELAAAVVAGGLAYVPLCLFEVKMSPQLHHMVYGFHQHDFGQTVRFGGYRPMVFMQHGLMVALWMTAATLSAFWLWHTKAIRQVWHVPVGWAAAILGATAILCKSALGLLLLAIGITVLCLCKRVRRPWPVLCLVLVVPAYCTLRVTGAITGDSLLSTSQALFGADRAQSLETRLKSEHLYIDKSMQRPILGWGGWNRTATWDEESHFSAIPDGLWIITLGENGVLGLATLLAGMLIGPVMLHRRVPVDRWSAPPYAAAAAMAVVVALYMVDNLMNAMVNPVYAVAAGGIVGFVAVRPTSPPGGRSMVSTARGVRRVRNRIVGPAIPPAAGRQMPTSRSIT